MKKERLILNFNIAYDAVTGSIFRSILTALGIIFGVAAVIAMMAIGKGAQQEILDQLKMVGVNNIEIKALADDEREDLQSANSGSSTGKGSRYTPGLNLKDAIHIQEYLPYVSHVCPEASVKKNAVFEDVQKQVNIIGTQATFFDIFHFSIYDGNGFSESQETSGSPVCIIGKNVESLLFKGKKPPEITSNAEMSGCKLLA